MKVNPQLSAVSENIQILYEKKIVQSQQAPFYIKTKQFWCCYVIGWQDGRFIVHVFDDDDDDNDPDEWMSCTHDSTPRSKSNEC